MRIDVGVPARKSTIPGVDCPFLIQNTTNVYGPTSFCSKTAPGFNLFINMNETNHFYNWVSHIQKMMTALGAADVIDWQNTTRNYTTSNDILGINQPIGTVQAIKVVSASSTYYGFIHLIAALCLVAATASLIVPPRWISGGKSSLANFQRSGILTLILGAIGFIMTLVAFGCYFTFVSSTKSALNKINGISAGYSNSNVIWVSQTCTDDSAQDHVLIYLLHALFSSYCLRLS